MNNFTYSCPTKVYFGKKSAAQALGAELGRVGGTVLLAYGGGSVKRNGVYDEMKSLLEQAGKRWWTFPALCQILPTRKCWRERLLPGNVMRTSFLQWAAEA